MPSSQLQPTGVSERTMLGSRVPKNAQQDAFTPENIHSHEPRPMLGDVKALAHPDRALSLAGRSGSADQKELHVLPAPQHLKVVIVAGDVSQRRAACERAADGITHSPVCPGQNVLG